jgi:hypothetical protein
MIDDSAAVTQKLNPPPHTDPQHNQHCDRSAGPRLPDQILTKA